MTAPVAGSGACPAWMARVSNCRSGVGAVFIARRIIGAGLVICQRQISLNLLVHSRKSLYHSRRRQLCVFICAEQTTLLRNGEGAIPRCLLAFASLFHVAVDASAGGTNVRLAAGHSPKK